MLLSVLTLYTVRVMPACHHVICRAPFVPSACVARSSDVLTGRSTLEVEKEAIAWAKIGLARVGDVIDMTRETFKKRYPWLKIATYENLQKEWPEAWKQAIAMRRKGEPTEEKTTIGCKETLQTKVGKGIR